jgi:hypothetical protein
VYHHGHGRLSERRHLVAGAIHCLSTGRALGPALLVGRDLLQESDR